MIGRIFYIIAATACVCTAVEIFARDRFPQLIDRNRFEELSFIRLLNSGVIYKPGTSNYDRRFGFLNSANIRETITTDEYSYTVETNSLGFRTREITPKPIHQRRLMLLGDSMFFGIGVDYPQTIPALLENMSDSLAVYNFAMLGHNTVQSLIATRAFATAVAPEHIFCGVFIGNDLISNALNYADGKNHIATHFDQVATTKTRLRQALAPYAWSTALRAMAYSVYLPRLRYQMAAETNNVEATCRHLAAIDRTASAIGSAFTAVLIYPKDAVAGGLTQQWSQSQRPGRLVADHCSKRGIEVLDLLDYIASEADRDRYYYARDGHFNAAGNARIAQLLHEYDQPR